MYRFTPPAALLLVALISFATLGQNASPQSGHGRHRGAHLFSRLDTNHDGQISRDEWRGKPEMFDRLDSNHDGVISQDEARQAGREIREHRKMRLREMDTNHDGQINREEWKGRPEVFDRLDLNHDGVLTREELRGRRRRPPSPTGASTPPTSN